MIIRDFAKAQKLLGDKFRDPRNPRVVQTGDALPFDLLEKLVDR